MSATNDPRDARRVLVRLRRELDRDLERVRGLTPVEERGDEVDELLTDLDRQAQRVRDAAVITLVGATGAGKSTLLNALVGRTIAVEGESRPTTSAPVVYRPRDADVRALLADLPGEAPRVEDYDPAAGGPWREQILIDAPDINSVAEAHREVVRALAQRSDVLVVVAHRQSVSELASVAFVDAFAGRRGMLFVLNRADELLPEARDGLLRELSRLASERWGAPDAPVIATSARDAQSRPSTPGWDELCRRLRELVRDGVLGRVRRHNAIGTIERLSGLFREVGSALSPDLEALEEATAGGLAAWSERVRGEVGERLRLRAPHVKELLWTEAARRWDGPGGWSLRAGGLASLGMGAGAALVRRHPLVAAGTAVGALAADRAREAVRGVELRDAAGVLPSASELEGWYRTDLGEARLRAEDAAGSPTALGVPPAAALALSAADACEAAWNRLLERELPRAAEKGARFLLRWAVDLPVYALVGWVVWQAAHGFLQGAYVGLDLLVNAALLLFAWLLVTRFLVRSGLSWRARGLLGRVVRDVDQGLDQASLDLAQRSRGDVLRAREALARLAGADSRWRKRLLEGEGG